MVSISLMAAVSAESYLPISETVILSALSAALVMLCGEEISIPNDNVIASSALSILLVVIMVLPFHMILHVFFS